MSPVNGASSFMYSIMQHIFNEKIIMKNKNDNTEMVSEIREIIGLCWSTH